jgi:hypothetical protein
MIDSPYRLKYLKESRRNKFLAELLLYKSDDVQYVLHVKERNHRFDGYDSKMQMQDIWGLLSFWALSIIRYPGIRYKELTSIQ